MPEWASAAGVDATICGRRRAALLRKLDLLCDELEYRWKHECAALLDELQRRVERLNAAARELASVEATSSAAAAARLRGQIYLLQRETARLAARRERDARLLDRVAHDVEAELARRGEPAAPVDADAAAGLVGGAADERESDAASDASVVLSDCESAIERRLDEAEEAQAEREVVPEAEADPLDVSAALDAAALVVSEAPAAPAALATNAAEPRAAYHAAAAAATVSQRPASSASPAPPIFAAAEQELTALVTSMTQAARASSSVSRGKLLPAYADDAVIVDHAFHGGPSSYDLSVREWRALLSSSTDSARSWVGAKLLTSYCFMLQVPSLPSPSLSMFDVLACSRNISRSRWQVLHA